MDRPDPIEAVKRLSPKSLKVTLRDGTEKAVAVPQAGNRWARTSQVLDALQWVSIECLDKDGRVLGIVEGEEEDDLEEFAEESGGSVAMAKVMLEVMRTTMKETRQLVDAQLRGNAELVAAMTEGTRALNETYRTALQVQQAYLMAPQKEEGGGDEMQKMLSMAMMLQQGARLVAPTPKKEGEK